MIIDSFDIKTNAIINPNLSGERFKCDACIITFSHVIEEYVKENYKTETVGYLKLVGGNEPILSIDYNGKKIALYKTILGAPAAVGCLEEVREVIDTDKFIMFGGSGCLNKEIARGKITIPTEAYRDEGTSYHYVKPADYIKIKNSSIVAKFMEENKLPYVLGKTWTTDSFYRETEGNFEKKKNDGCISVEMECAAMQAVCNFRNVELYYFLSSGDLLDSPEWDNRIKNENDYTGTQHDSRLFDIAIELAEYLS